MTIVQEPPSARMPIDLRARERLRKAQRSEAAAVAAALRARSHQDTLQARLRSVVAKHDAAITEATSQLRAAQAYVVEVSGLERAGVLLNISTQELRAACAATRSASDRP
jgi:hypothetical protein